MKRNALLSTFLLLICACVTGCNESEERKGEEIFQGKLDTTGEIVYYYPDETTCVIDDTDQIKEICDILKNQTYRKDASGIEGGHLMKFVGDETIEIGLAQAHLSYNGTEYTVTDKEAFVEIFDIMEEIEK